MDACRQVGAKHCIFNTQKGGFYADVLIRLASPWNVVVDPQLK